MAAWQTQVVQFGVDSTALATAQAVTANGVVGSALTVGRCRFDINWTITGYTGGDAFDLIIFVVQANTIAAPNTWSTQEIGNLVIGDATGRGGEALTSLSNAVTSHLNQNDNQVRVYAYLAGSAVSATVTAILKPLSSNIS